MAQQAHKHDRQPGQDCGRICNIPTLHHPGRHSLGHGRMEKGFYYIAAKANMPILLYGIDYKKKLIECTRTIMPDGDIDRQMREIKLYFKRFEGLKPENFTTGDI